MITYTYIVKCPECEDEFFDFFDEAKEFALSCMSKKPIITQTEVERNDFGECTDHCDLGTIWSWEDMMQDTKSEDDTIFSKNETFGISEDLDDFDDFDIGPQSDEFDSIDNSVDFEIDEISDNFRKPIPEGMTIEQLVEEMEENEDTVECTWCNDLFDKSECRKEVDLGWLCSRCEAAIKSRGETLTFRENNYWDFLDEDITAERSLEDLVKDSINHLINDLGKDSTAEDFVDDIIMDIERNYDNFVPEEPENYHKWASAIACEVSRQLNNQLDERLDLNIDFSQVIDSSDMEIWGLEHIREDFYKAVLLKRFENVDQRGLDESQKVTDEMYDIDGMFTFYFLKDGSPDLYSWNVNLLGELGSINIEFEDTRYEDAVARVFNRKTFKEDVKEIHDLGNEYDGGYPAETPEVSDSHLRLCPECGKDTFDIETGVCVECGFN